MVLPSEKVEALGFQVACMHALLARSFCMLSMQVPEKFEHIDTILAS